MQFIYKQKPFQMNNKESMDISSHCAIVPVEPV